MNILANIIATFIIVFVASSNAAFVNGNVTERKGTGGAISGNTCGNGVRKPTAVRLYKYDFYQGSVEDVFIFWPKSNGFCSPFPDTFAGRVRSIDPFDNTVILWSNPDCTGFAVRISRHDWGASDLTRVIRRSLGFRSMQLARGVDYPDDFAGPPPKEWC